MIHLPQNHPEVKVTNVKNGDKFRVGASISVSAVGPVRRVIFLVDDLSLAFADRAPFEFQPPELAAANHIFAQLERLMNSAISLRVSSFRS